MHPVGATNKHMGSPPRVRGKPAPGRGSKVCGWITPARAGKTTPTASPWTTTPDHPRACGENPNFHVKGGGVMGSPPRVRGKRSPRCRRFVDRRITPARAGKTRCPRAGGFTTPDHPRACGENGIVPGGAIFSQGSPPRVRGKPDAQGSFVCPRGITPARAGKTLKCEREKLKQGDHPRACGENVFNQAPRRLDFGSPPRVRGKRTANESCQKPGRITPARAGKTVVRGMRRGAGADHPRACGENEKTSFSAFAASGSPPRVRGKLWPSPKRRARERITPARAGKTWRYCEQPVECEDHPRACGENDAAGTACR